MNDRVEPVPVVFRSTRRVEFSHTDAAGIAHFSSFFLFMEQVEHEFLRSRGLSVLAADAEGPISWPRVSAQCDYQGSARFEDVLDVELGLARVGEKSITYQFVFSSHGKPIARGRLTAVCCRLVDGGVQAIPIPSWFREKLPSGGDAPGVSPS